MEPTFHIGDLIIAHRESYYQVGDAVVYRNAVLENFVFHRIIAERMEHYTLQGDNNSWVDTYQPSKQEILGKLWLHIPRGGRALQKVRSPFMMAIIAAGLGMILASSLFSRKNKGNSTMNTKSFKAWFGSARQKIRSWLADNSTSGPQKLPSTETGTLWEVSFFAAGSVLLFSLIIGIISFSRPMSRIAQDDVQYQHLGIFSYLASAPQGVYDSNSINSGDPIFPRLTCTVDLNLQYTLIASQSASIAGTYQLMAVIREETSGWQRRVPLQEETAFSGTSFGTTAKLDLCKMESLVTSMEDETSFSSGLYTLSVGPNVKVNGMVAGQALQGTFNSGMEFVYNRVHFYLAKKEAIDSTLNITETITIHSEHTEVNTVSFLGTELAIPTLRWLAITGLLVSLAGFVVLGIRLQNLANTDPAHFFHVRYDALLVDVQNVDLDGSVPTDVMSINALAKLAERFNTVILHVTETDSHEYYVQSAGKTYRFGLHGRTTGSTVPEKETLHHGGKS